MTEAALFAFLMVFTRCSALFLTSPVFGAQNTPIMIRILTTLSISAALTCVVQPKVGPLPTSLFELATAAGKEVLAGVLIGTLVSLAMQAMTMAGGLMDLQTGLGSSHVLNPLNGVQSTVLSQFKSVLAIVVFLTSNAHHLLIQAFAKSYGVLPSFGAIQSSLLETLAQISILALEIAAPVMAVGLIVDAALALLSRAVPQMQAMHVGMPAKIGVGLATVALGVPMTVISVSTAIGFAFGQVQRLFHF